MKQIKLLKTLLSSVFFFIVIFIGTFLLPSSSHGIAFPDDTIELYENGVKVTDNNTLGCTKGTCIIGQQSYPVIIYRLKSEDVLTYPEFVLKHPYKGNYYDGQAKDLWNAENKAQYVEYLKENTLYSTVFDPKESTVLSCYPGGLGPRLFELDLKTGEYKEKITPQTIRNIAGLTTIAIILITALYLITVLIKRSRKKAKK